MIFENLVVVLGSMFLSMNRNCSKISKSEKTTKKVAKKGRGKLMIFKISKPSKTWLHFSKHSDLLSSFWTTFFTKSENEHFENQGSKTETGIERKVKNGQKRKNCEKKSKKSGPDCSTKTTVWLFFERFWHFRKFLCTLRVWEPKFSLMNKV